MSRVAIIGGGVSGLVAAYLLDGHHQVSVFEADAIAGGHVRTVPVQLGAATWAVDTGFIVYNNRNYPNFARLLERIGVATKPSSMSWSVRSDRTGRRLEYNGSSLRRLFAQRRNLLRPAFHRMLVDIVRFNRDAPRAIRNGARTQTMGELLASGGYSEGFREDYLLAMGSALWSVPPPQVLEMPAEFFVRFFENHGMLSMDERPEWRVIAGGSARYVEALIRPFADRVRLATPVRRVSRSATGVLVDGEPFDHVIFACHSDQALGILTDASVVERDILGAFPYQANDVTLHTDVTVLPGRRQAWAAWNYAVGPTPSLQATVTYNMNTLQTLDAPETFCVTLNAATAIAPERVVRRFRFHHPVYTMAGVAAQGRWSAISGVNRTHFCGAYWGNGFHEAGVVSAIAVARHLGGSW